MKHGCETFGHDKNMAPETERLLVIVNHSTVSRTLAISEPETALAGCTQFAPALGSPQASLDGQGSVVMQLAPEQAAIYLVH